MREHILTAGCWCGPRIEAVCDECDGAGCWCCGNEGVIKVYAETDTDAALIIVHNDSDPEATGLPIVNEASDA